MTLFLGLLIKIRIIEGKFYSITLGSNKKGIESRIIKDYSYQFPLSLPSDSTFIFICASSISEMALFRSSS
jgi:hypothetical protein